MRVFCSDKGHLTALEKVLVVLSFRNMTTNTFSNAVVLTSFFFHFEIEDGLLENLCGNIH